MNDQSYKLEVINNLINQLEGVSFPGNWLWTTQEREMYLDRYLRITNFLKNMPENKNILEIGLCRGVFAFLVKRLFINSRVFAIEHPLTSSQYTKKFLQFLSKEKIELKLCNLETDKIPWDNNFFDFVMFSEVMEHLTPATTLKTLTQIHRVLKKDGTLFLSTPNIASLIKRINLLMGNNSIELDTRLHQKATYGHIREYTMQEVIRLLKENKFKIVKIQYQSFDVNRNFYLKVESILSRIYPALGNSIMVLARK